MILDNDDIQNDTHQEKQFNAKKTLILSLLTHFFMTIPQSHRIENVSGVTSAVSDQIEVLNNFIYFFQAKVLRGVYRFV